MLRLISCNALFRSTANLALLRNPTCRIATRRNISFKFPNIRQAIAEANRIDEKFEEAGKSPVETKVQQIIAAVDGVPELLYQLNFFFCECRRIGILQDNAGQRQHSIRYWPVFMFRLIPLNSAFWDTCYFMNKAQHTHKLHPFKINDVGLLDPKNFPLEFIEELATGRYKGLDFRNTSIMTFAKPKFAETKEGGKIEKTVDIKY
ncbi:uncharacterized protein LODBEIA_P03210 [Lodderomyces beijingensis]|uniref:Uncharacterized protein n=1 Tax=Lodderomyces beijingensis TaxID=1775926 RepID=A0ABP0ZF65_9ASCO